MRRADLRLIREQLEEALAELLAADLVAGEPGQRLARARGTLGDIIARLPDAAANGGRAERLASQIRQL